MKYKWNIIFLPVTLLFSGCGIYSNYHRPEVLSIDSLYRDVPVLTNDTASLADMSWRELFTDPLLVKWIEVALEKNSDLQTARLQTQEAQATLQSSRLSFLPSMSLEPQGALKSFNGAKPAKTYSLDIVSEWEIDAFGGLRNAKKGSHAAWAASSAYEQAVQTQLVATVAETYYSLLALDRQLFITRETASKWKENVRVMQALKRAGEKDDAAVAQAEASRLEAEVSVLSLEKQVRELENSLATLVGIAPTEIERGQRLELSLPEKWSVGIPVLLLSQRPDVRQAEWQLAEAFYATNEARLAFYPQITLSGSAGWTNNSGAGIVNPGKWLLNAVGGLVQPLFNKGRNVANLKIAKAQQQEALITFKQKLLDAGAEVNNALTQWQMAQKSLELDSQKVEALKTAVRSTQLLMEHGNTNYLEVLTAQQTLLQAQLAEVSDQYNQIEGIISLYHALGGGAK